MGSAIERAILCEEEACQYREQQLRRQLATIQERLELLRLARYELERERDRDAAEARRAG